ncbi:hypothetical protein CBS101457_002230 [Exobasidium rhododendri]|nr:hypothetical protein CBS101457_002230 [Exobasidium rhododendri]
MSAVEPILQALKGSAEMAMGHFRPPGGFKPGGAQWKAANLPIQSLSKLASPQAVSSTTAVSSSQASIPHKGVHKLFRAVFENAFLPVFRGFRVRATDQPGYEQTAAKVRHLSHSAQGSLRRAGPPKVMYHSTPRPRVPGGPKQDYNTSGLGRNPRFATTLPAELFYQAPFGLRAAADEIEDRLRQYGQNKKGTATSASACRGLTREKPVVKRSKVAELVAEANLYKAEASTSSSTEQSDDCISCSSSLVSVDDSEGDNFFQFIDTPVQRTWVVTTLSVPMSPALRTILAADLEAEPHETILTDNFWNGVNRIDAEYDKYRLRIILPLERALQSGHLSLLQPQIGGASNLSAVMHEDGEWMAVLSIKFINSTQDDVLEKLRHDVTPGVFTWLQDFIHEERVNDNDEQVQDLDQQAAFSDDIWRGTSGVDQMEVSAMTAGMFSSSLEDLGQEINGYGPATLASMEEDVDGQMAAFYRNRCIEAGLPLLLPFDPFFPQQSI